MTVAYRARGVPMFRPPLETEEQRHCVALFRAAGFIVGPTSQYRRSGQMIGLPDLVLLHLGLKRAGYWETKAYRPQGYDPRRRETWVPKVLQPAQLAFRDMALECGQLYGAGGHAEAEAWLIDLHLMERAGNGSVQLRAYWAGQTPRWPMPFHKLKR